LKTTTFVHTFKDDDLEREMKGDGAGGKRGIIGQRIKWRAPTHINRRSKVLYGQVLLVLF
jgi:hypothetical protein